MTRLAFAIALVLAALFSPVRALAQADGKPAEVAKGAQIATGPSAAPLEVATDDPFFRLAFGIDGGIAIIDRERVGGFARLGADGTMVKDLRRSRFVWGFWDAYEGWFAKNGRAFALPVVAYIGYRQAPFLATLGGGLNVFTIDHLDGDTGAGILSPRGDLRIGLDFDSVVVMAHSDIQYRWLWGRDDISLIQLGLSIGIGPGFVQSKPPR